MKVEIKGFLQFDLGPTSALGKVGQCHQDGRCLAMLADLWKPSVLEVCVDWGTSKPQIQGAEREELARVRVLSSPRTDLARLDYPLIGGHNPFGLMKATFSDDSVPMVGHAIGAREFRTASHIATRP